MKSSYTITGADLGGGVQGVHPPPPPRDDLRLSAELKHETRLKNYVKRRKIAVKMVVPLARFRRRTFHEPNLIRIKADPNY